MIGSLVVKSLGIKLDYKCYRIASMCTSYLDRSGENFIQRQRYAAVLPSTKSSRIFGSQPNSIFSHSISKSLRRDGISFQPSRNFSLQSIADAQMSLYRSISESSIVGVFQDFLIWVHSTTGLPWWASIIVSTVIIRTSITVPLAIYQNYIFAKVENISMEMPEIAKELHMETVAAKQMFNWTDKQATIMFRRSLKKQYNKLIVRDNCHPFKASLLIWFQIPLWVSLSFSLRNIVHMQPKFDIDAQLRFAELTVGGFGWIPNLTVPDHSLIFPVTLGLLNLLIIEIQTMSKIRVESKFQKYITNFFRVFSICMIPISSIVPSCMCLYWVTSSTYGLAQNLVLMSPRVKRMCGIPITPTEIENPYTHVRAEMKRKISRLLMLKIKPD